MNKTIFALLLAAIEADLKIGSNPEPKLFAYEWDELVKELRKLLAE